MAVNGGKTVLNDLRVVIVKNLNDIPERSKQQHLIQMGCLTVATMQVFVVAFPHRIIIGGRMPILPSVCAATVGAADLVGEQGKGGTVPIRMPQPILYFRKYCFGDDAWVTVFDEVAGYSYGNFHHDFMRDKVTMIGCPKLDMVDYSEKLTEVFKYNNIRSITVTRMTVPCCGGLSYAVKTAIENSGKKIPLHIVTISPDGKIMK